MTSANAPRIQAREFSPNAVRLLPSLFKDAEEANGRYLLQLEPDRLLAGFLQNAGLEPKGEKYGGWESMTIAGHSLGHYLSACSHQYAATGDERFRERVTYIVRELARCQARRPDGYLFAVKDGDRVWSEVRQGEIRSKGFDLNGLWVPWYTMHKIFAGLIDACEVGQVKEALPVVKRLGEWAIDVTKGLDDEQWQRMLACEHGGMNESLAELSQLTKDARFLTLARKFHHDAVLNPLARREDRMAGLHGNTQIPKVIGLARLYEIGGKPEDRTAAEFFWDRIVNHRSYVIGGNSDHEHLSEPDQLSAHLSANTAETCNTYNMLKLTRHLFEWQPKASLMDYYERAMTNHILASQRREDGMLMYFMPLQPVANKPFSTPFDSFWCCVGTGMENHARYGEAIYAHRGHELFVNLYVPSTLNAKELGTQVRLDSGYPTSGNATLTFDRDTPGELTLALRQPSWANGANVRLNGTGVNATPDADGYLRIGRPWRKGDRVDIEFPMKLRTEAMPDNPKRIALLYGPNVLAAVNHEGDVAPVVVPHDAPVSEWLEPVPGSGLRFRSKGVLRPRDLEFVPYYGVNDERYTVYLDDFTDAEWKVREREIREEEERQRRLEAATVDVFRPGEMQPERDHGFEGDRTETGEFMGRKWRHAAGSFSFRMKVDPAVPNSLVLSFFGGDAGRRYEIFVDGHKIGDAPYEGQPKDRFFDKTYPLDGEWLRGKTEIVVRLVAEKDSLAGGLFGARTLRSELLK